MISDINPAFQHMIIWIYLWVRLIPQEDSYDGLLIEPTTTSFVHKIFKYLIVGIFCGSSGGPKGRG